MGVGDSIRAAESGGDNYAKNDLSSAYGPDQFLAGTWLDTLKSNRPDLAQGKSDAELLAMRSDPDLSGQMRDAYAAKNSAILSKAGLPVTPGTTYLAHFAGPGGAVKLLSADPSTPAGDILGPGVVAANPFIAKMTAGDVAAWAGRKMGGPPQQTAPQAAPQPVQAGPAPVSAPAGQPQPRFTTPFFAGGGPAAQPAASQGPPAPAPIFASPTKPVDLTKLRAAFAAPNFFAKG
jgi:hypothetical protein